MCRPLASNGACISSREWLCPGDKDSGTGSPAANVLGEVPEHALASAPTTSAAQADAHHMGGLTTVLLAFAGLIACIPAILITGRALILRQRRLKGGGGTAAKHSRIASNDEAMHEGDDDILGDDGAPSLPPVPEEGNRSEASAAIEPAQPSNTDPDSPGPMAKDAEDELLKRVAALLRDEPARVP